MVASSGSNSLAETLLADLRKVDPAEEPERAEDILSRIKDIPMSRAILKKTGIGRVVGRIARKAPPRVAAVAKPIVKRWKSIVCEERKGEMATRCGAHRAHVAKLRTTKRSWRNNSTLMARRLQKKAMVSSELPQRG